MENMNVSEVKVVLVRYYKDFTLDKTSIYYIYFDIELSNIELNKIGLLYTDEFICIIFRQQSFFELIPKNCMFHYDVEEGVPS